MADRDTLVSIKSNPRDISHDVFDRLIYLRIFEGCNLHCEHCFIPNNPKRIPLDMFKTIPDIIRKFTPEDGRVLLQWHGGEPTALGAKWLEQGLLAIEENKENLQIVHGIQTNLLNYNNEWAEIYHKYFDSSVGISWDVDIRHIRGQENSNAAFEKVFWKNIEQLIADDLEPYLVVTSTRNFFERFRNPFEMFDFFESKGIFRLHIERLTEVGNARDNWDRIGLTNKEYSTYMARLYKAYALHLKRNQNRDTIRISPFDGLSESVDRLVSGEAGGYGCLSGACDSKYHTIDANGYKAGCTALNSEYDNNRTESNVQIIKFVDFTSERKVRQETCEGCEFKPICSSGCLATDKFDDSGECSGGKIIFNAIKSIKKI